ncbi:glycohydrolase toxin TNT-related protein [Saccharopolyspora indica]|uniref:glycohydrolase toxin TNT-related protein n=1 Tax=Saccharopolyspora indica TaxID=1229659 RepID=UPI0022EA50C9|nr:glycohydrolase toxin TNT-related protein [Saccharopolyspora indica]MDA3647433.1 glycohydrolase toxin TNT-related protein [Saccharopolyspora indica]
MSRPTAISPEEQEQIARKIGVLLLQGAPEDWQEITVEYRATGEYHDLLGEVTAQDGSARSLEPPAELREIFESLREGMYRPDVGTWLSALYVVERPSSYRIDINFDTEPGWQRPLPRAAYVDELRRYPRAEENIPDWMRERIDGTAPAPGAPVDDAPVAPPVAEEPVVAPPAVAEDEPTGFQVASSFDDFDEQGRPVVADREPVPAEEIAQLRQYLENAPVVLAAREDEEDQLDPERPTVVPSTWHTDGAWLWPGAIAFYLAQYGVPPESEFVAHVRRRGFQLAEVDDATRDAAVSELLDQPTDSDDDPQNFADEPQDYADEPRNPIADAPAYAAEPDDEPSYAEESRDFADEPQDFAEPEAAEAEPAGGSRHVLEDEDELPDTGEVLAVLHDRLTEFQVDGDGYRIGSHSESARCLVQDGPDWVVTTSTGRGEDVRFARVDDAAAYLLGSLLMERRPAAAEPELPHDEPELPQRTPEAELPQRTPEPDLPQRTPEPAHAPEAELPQRAPESGLPQRTPEAELPQRTPEPALPQRTPEAELPQRAPEPDLPQRTPEAELPQRAPEPGLPQRTPGSDLPQRPEPERAPEPAAANPLFTANQDPAAPSAPPEPPVQHDAAPPQEEATRLQQPPQLDRPAPPAAPPSPPVGQPVQQPPVSGPGGVPPLPKRQPRRESGAPAQQQGAPGPVGGAERRPGPGGPGMAGPHRQGPPPGPPRPPQAGGQQPGGQQPGGQQPGGQQPGGQQIQPLNGEPPLTLYRDRRVIMLQPGTELDRFGEPNGNVLYAMRTPYTHRSLPPQWSNRSYFAYRIQRPVQALRGTAVPWFEQPGGGTAFVLPAPVSDLLADGTLAEMPATERPPME